MSLVFLLRHLCLAVAAATILPSQAETTFAVGYQVGVDPAKVALADGRYEKATGQAITWRRFNTGPEVIAALASGDLQIGEIGSSPLAAATSRRLPIVAFMIASQTSTGEALVVRQDSAIDKPADLAGKTIATPFVSTSHYSLLGALKHWHIDPATVRIVNLKPAEISAGWRRGDIDGAFVWAPVLDDLKKNGYLLTDASEVGNWGSPTFQVWVARKDFAERHPEILARFTRVSLEAFSEYNAHKSEWTADSDPVQKIARLTGADPLQVPALLAGTHYPDASEQLSSELLGGGTVKSLADTAQFLKAQKLVPSVLDDYTPYVTDKFVRVAQQPQFGQR
ncbi:taurine ABC transporter substrate-binding protein [Pseudomonas monteilii]|uniref:taurine ABC transporter substrate-binding protein n=1 Tax=Pseudomonas monteilii TaxID=76759 RepID=UPI003D0055EF